MPFQLVHDVEVIDPVLVAIDSPDVRICPTLVADFSLQQAIIHGVLHLGGAVLGIRVVASSQDGVGGSGGAGGRAARVDARKFK